MIRRMPTRLLVRAAWAAFACVSGAAVSPVRADVVVTLAGPPGEVAAGADVPVTLYYLNTGPAAADPPAAPPELAARLSVGGRTVDAVLRRAPAAAAPAEPLAVGRFIAVAYVLTVPASVSGPVTIDAATGPGQPPARTAVVVAADAGGGPTAAVPPAAPAAAPSPVPAAPPPGRAAEGGPVVVPRGAEVLPNRAAVPVGDSGLAEAILPRFSPHEPIYFIAGADRPNAKFQISFKYQIFNPEGPLAQRFWPIAGFHVAYTQTSLWDWEGESAPFRDSSYRPELLWSAPDIRPDSKVVSRIGFQAGLQHESNGRDGADSRSLNVVYARPSVTFGDYKGLFLTVAPRVQAYVADLGDNPDIKDYRGYGELRLIAGHRDGLQASVAARVGDDWDKGSVQVDLSYPLRQLLGGNVDLYLHAQYFNGFGESLLDYNESTSQFRVGFSLVR
jgi:phospholipase A1